MSHHGNARAHVFTEVLDFMADRLPPERVAAIRAHLDGCPECSESYAWAKEFRDEVRRRGPKHVSPEVLVSLTDDPGLEIDARDRTHLDACLSCQAELSEMRRLAPPPGLASDRGTAPRPAAAAVSRPVPGRRAGGVVARLPKWFWVPAIAAAAVAVAVWSVNREDPIRRLARREPLPVQLPRASMEVNAFDENWIEGLEAYDAGRFGEAELRLAAAARHRPDHGEVFLYLGSAQLLRNHLPAAVESLKRAEANASSPLIAGESRWHLAQAWLRSSRPGEARDVLEKLLTSDSPRAAEARDLLSRLKPHFR